MSTTELDRLVRYNEQLLAVAEDRMASFPIWSHAHWRWRGHAKRYREVLKNVYKAEIVWYRDTTAREAERRKA